MRTIDFPHKITPQKYDFEGEISQFFDFRFNTHIYFPESGSRKHFHVSGMRAIDFSPRNYHKKSVFRRKSEIFFDFSRMGYKCYAPFNIKNFIQIFLNNFLISITILLKIKHIKNINL